MLDGFCRNALFVQQARHQQVAPLPWVRILATQRVTAGDVRQALHACARSHRLAGAVRASFEMDPGCGVSDIADANPSRLRGGLVAMPRFGEGTTARIRFGQAAWEHCGLRPRQAVRISWQPSVSAPRGMPPRHARGACSDKGPRPAPALAAKRARRSSPASSPARPAFAMALQRSHPRPLYAQADAICGSTSRAPRRLRCGPVLAAPLQLLRSCCASRHRCSAAGCRPGRVADACFAPIQTRLLLTPHAATSTFDHCRRVRAIASIRAWRCALPRPPLAPEGRDTDPRILRLACPVVPRSAPPGLSRWRESAELAVLRGQRPAQARRSAPALALRSDLALLAVARYGRHWQRCAAVAPDCAACAPPPRCRHRPGHRETRPSLFILRMPRAWLAPAHRGCPAGMGE